MLTRKMAEKALKENWLENVTLKYASITTSVILNNWENWIVKANMPFYSYTPGRIDMFVSDMCSFYTN